MKGMLDGDANCFVAEVDGNVVGVATVEPKGHHIEDRHAGIYANALIPSWRGKGVGSRRMTAMLNAGPRKFENLYLTVGTDHTSAVRLYRKQGFEECGRLPRSWHRNGRYLDDVLMWRPVELPGPAPPPA